ncbi:MAG: hypothetical protein AAF765_01165, partial [Bacteroidota bacterium]
DEIETGSSFNSETTTSTESLDGFCKLCFRERWRKTNGGHQISRKAARLTNKCWGNGPGLFFGAIAG